MNLIQQFVKESLQDVNNRQGGGDKETITKRQLKEIIKCAVKAVLNEISMGFSRMTLEERALTDEGISSEDMQSAWNADQSGEYIQIKDDGSAWYVNRGIPKQQIAPKKSGARAFDLIIALFQKHHIYLNIWQVGKNGIQLMNRAGKVLGALGAQMTEMTTTSAVSPINLPGNVKGGWVSGRGGSRRGVAGSKSLGYELTSIGRKDMDRPQDNVYEQ